MSALILVVNGPNLNLLGTRRPEVYGRTTLPQIEQLLAERAEQRGVQVQCIQSNHEGELIDAIQQARGKAQGIIINPAAYSHTSVALHDALEAVELPTVEVHLSNIHRREPFRHHSYISPVAETVIAGAGVQGYLMALDLLAQRFTD